MVNFGSSSDRRFKANVGVLAEVLAQIVVKLDLDIDLPESPSSRPFQKKLDEVKAGLEESDEVFGLAQRADVADVAEDIEALKESQENLCEFYDSKIAELEARFTGPAKAAEPEAPSKPEPSEEFEVTPRPPARKSKAAAKKG